MLGVYGRSHTGSHLFTFVNVNMYYTIVYGCARPVHLSGPFSAQLGPLVNVNCTIDCRSAMC